MRYLIIFLSILIFVLPAFAGPQPETLSVSVLNWNGTPAVNGIQFPVTEATLEDPWVRSHQYLYVTYNSDEDVWGIRIVTKNRGVFVGMAPKILGIGSGADNIRGTADDTWRPGPDGIWDTADDVWGYGSDGIPGTNDDTVCTSFGGLIDPATKNNPNYRADLAWQVYKDPVYPSEPHAIYYASWGSWYGYWNVGSNPVFYSGAYRYPYQWAYVVDSNNYWNGTLAISNNYVCYDPQPPVAWNARYEMIVIGSPLTKDLTQYPPARQTNPPRRPGDCDIAVYLAACFGIMENYQCTSLLPAGSYSASLYIELIVTE